jgi:hypothetical protein
MPESHCLHGKKTELIRSNEANRHNAIFSCFAESSLNKNEPQIIKIE